MKRIKNQLAVGLICLLLGLMLAFQFKSVQENYLEGAVPAEKSKELEAQLKNLREEKQKLLELSNALDDQIKQLEADESEEDIIIKTISNGIDRYRALAGLKNVKGPGVVITMNDPSMNPDLNLDMSILVAHYDLLLSVINKLNAAGAEAISINGQRVSNYTAITSNGKNIYVNSVPISLPIVMHALGNPDNLESRLNIKYGILYEMREQYGLDITIQEKEELEIPGYNEAIKFQYANVAGTQVE